MHKYLELTAGILFVLILSASKSHLSICRGFWGFFLGGGNCPFKGFHVCPAAALFITGCLLSELHASFLGLKW